MGIIVGIKDQITEVHKVTDKPFRLGFRCMICDNFQEVKAVKQLDATFLICDACKNDLREMIMRKRENDKK